MSGRRRKNIHKGKGFKLLTWVIVVLIFVFIKINGQSPSTNNELRPLVKEIVQKETSPEEKWVSEKIKQAVNLENNKEYAETVEIYNEITHKINHSPLFTKQYKSDVWTLKTNLHLRLWQHADAKIALDEAMRLGTSGQKKNLKKLANWLENVVEKINLERNNSTSYLATPDTGPSANFFGKIGVVHLFIEEKTGRNWGLKQRTFSLTSMGEAKRWFKKEVGKYGKSVNFKHRVYLINRNPAIKRLAIGTNMTQYSNANIIVFLAVKQLGAENVLDFLLKQKNEMQTDEVMLMLHVNKSGRSFAKRCLLACSVSGEYTFILEKAVTKKWQSMEYAQAHESLHLFGADDLYNIKQSVYYATRDIMNYTSKYLDASVIEPVTAYSIGLTNKKPKTPFVINLLKY